MHFCLLCWVDTKNAVPIRERFRAFVCSCPATGSGSNNLRTGAAISFFRSAYETVTTAVCGVVRNVGQLSPVFVYLVLFVRSFVTWCCCSLCRHHMEPEWAAVELLECIDSELNPGGSAEQQQQLSSQTTLSAIRVLPAPVAGDLFVTCAARGHIGVILFYFEEGEENATSAGQDCRAECHSFSGLHPSWCKPTTFADAGHRHSIPAPSASIVVYLVVMKTTAVFRWVLLVARLG